MRSAVDTPTRLPRTPLRDVTDAATRVSGPGSNTATSSGWLSSSDSINHGRFAPGLILDNRYRILSLLGRGGMGEVYRADDLRLGQPVASKLLPRAVRSEPVRLARCRQAARDAETSGR